jgi:ATP-dependent exoDNAse (exonuclease V) beta subunit
MRALNRAIANVEDGLALGALLASDFVPMTSDALAILRLGAGERDSRSLWTLLNERRCELASADQEAAERLIGVLEAARQRVGRRPLVEVLLLAVEESGWDLRLLADGNTGRDAFANVLKFARQAAAFEESIGSGPAGFALHLDAKERFGDTEAPASLADDGSNAVRLMSIHASKGLEFPIVVVPALAGHGRSDQLAVRISRRDGAVAIALKTPAGDEGQARASSTWFSGFSDEATDAAAEENARVLYVACTRARELLILSGAMNLRPVGGTKAKNDLVRLSGILGVRIPVAGPSERVAELPGSRCRVRILDAAAHLKTTGAGVASGAGARTMLPPAGKGIVTDAPRAPAPERLSYTQLSEFEHCPKRFWIRRVLGIRPTSISDTGSPDPLQFGTALHAVLRLVAADGSPPSAERIATIAMFYELGDGGGARLAQAVSRYCESSVARRAAAGDSVRRESPFSLRIGGRFLLTGSIDLYSRTGSSAFVVDYKSGETGDPAELRDRYRLQAECYALAVLRDGCERVEVTFVRPEVGLAEGSEVQSATFDFDASDAERIERDLVHRYAEIEASAFDPRPSAECYHCDVPRGMCPERS